jgi:cysteine desulfurase
MMSIAGHKFGAPNGIGALYLRGGTSLVPMMHGGGQERGRRAGTESGLLAAGLHAAITQIDMSRSARIKTLRDYFWQQLQSNFGSDVVVNANLQHCVPNTMSISFPGKVGADILAQMPHVAATTGSACHAGCIDMSHVLIAMGKSVDHGLGSIRFSLGATNTTEEIDDVIMCLRRSFD